MYVSYAGILEQSMGARSRNRVGIRLSYRRASLNRQAESIPWNRILGSLNVYNSGSSHAFKWEVQREDPIFLNPLHLTFTNIVEDQSDVAEGGQLFFSVQLPKTKSS